MRTEVVKELYQEYERFNIYKTYFITKDKDGKVINKKPRWNETVPKRKIIKRKTLAD